MARKTLRFHLESTNPHIFPMARLADYLKKLSIVFGHEDKVHFVGVEEGSLESVIEVDEEIEPILITRTREAERGMGPRDAVQAYRSLRESLEEASQPAALEREDGELVTEFVSPPTAAGEEAVGPFWQEGSLDGLLTRIEGIDETIHVTLIFEGSRCKAETSREIGMQMGPRFYKVVRVFGRGRWYRQPDGKWELQKFIIRSFEDLEDVSLLDTVARLRAIPDNDLKTLEDPIGEMLKIRRGEE